MGTKRKARKPATPRVSKTARETPPLLKHRFDASKSLTRNTPLTLSITHILSNEAIIARVD